MKKRLQKKGIEIVKDDVEETKKEESIMELIKAKARLEVMKMGFNSNKIGDKEKSSQNSVIDN